MQSFNNQASLTVSVAEQTSLSYLIRNPENMLSGIKTHMIVMFSQVSIQPQYLRR